MAKQDLTQQQIDRLAALYLVARERLLDTIIHYEGVGTKTYANTILRQLQRELAELQKQSGKFIETAIPREYRKGLREIYAYFTRNHLRMKNPSAFASLHTDALYEISREMQYQISDGLATVGRQVSRYVEGARDEALRLAGLTQTGIKTASGGSVQDMKNALEKELKENGFMTVQYGAGPNTRQVPFDVYAAMVARSTGREAGNTARINQLAASGYDLVKMSTHYPTCEVCAPLQDRVYSVSGKDERFPPLSKAFGAYNNIHPNCRHVISPWVESMHTPEEAAEAIKKSNAPFEDTRSAKEVALYKEQQDKGRQARNTIYQYERYKERLGDDAPKTWMGFARIKKAGGEQWELLQEKYKKALTADEKTALNRYISSDSYKINEKLRSGVELNDDDRWLVSNLDRALDKLPKHEGVTYRSLYAQVTPVSEILESMKVGNTVESPAYSSSSKDVYDSEDDVRLIMRSKTGADLKGYNDEEKEVLFRRDTLFKVADVWYDNKKPFIMLEEI